MKIENLHIERRPSYDSDYANMLVGMVQLTGTMGKMEVKLSNSVVGRIFNLIKEDVQKTADYNAGQASRAVEDAASEHQVLEHITEDK